MTITSEFYLARAADCAAEAKASPLANVRERSLRAEAAWRAMADRIARTDAIRKTHADAKLDEIAATSAG